MAQPKNRPEGTKGKLKTFYPLVGSLESYPQNLSVILEAINQRGFSRSQGIDWLTKEFKAGPDFSRKLLDTLRQLGFLTYDRNQKTFALTREGQEYVQRGERELMVNLLIERVEGITELLQIIGLRQALSKADVVASLNELSDIKLARNQIEHRLNWLRGFGCLQVISRNYLLTELGLKVLADARMSAGTTTQEKLSISHSDLEDKIQLIGQFFQFETIRKASINHALPSYALKLTEQDRQLDCLWVRYVPFGGKIKFPVEVQIGGNLADSIDRLETVCEYVQKAIIITDADQEKKIVERLKVKRSRLLDKLVVISVEDVYKAVEATNVLRALTDKIFAD